MMSAFTENVLTSMNHWIRCPAAH